MRNLLLITVITVCPLASADAAMYKCVEDGRVTYQGTPCHGSGTEINMPAADAAAAAASKGTPDDPSAVAARFDEQSKRLVAEQKMRDLDREIKNIEAEIADDQSAMNSELDALQKKKDFWKNQLGGSTWEQNASDEMKTVTDKYTAKIQTEQDKLTQLNKEKAALKAQIPRSETNENRRKE